MHRSSAALAAVLLTLTLTSMASADSYCVAPATGCDHTATSLQDALTQAGTHAGEDSISVGAATYAQDNLVYNPGDHALVSITGAGQDATTIRRQTSSNAVLTISGLGGPIALTGLTVLTGDSTSDMAVQLQYGGSLDHVKVQSAPGASHPIGVEALKATQVTNSRFDVEGDQSCLSVGGAGTTKVLDTAITGCAYGLASRAGATFAHRLRITDVTYGLQVPTGTAYLDDSIIRSTATAVGVNVEGSSAATVYMEQDTLIGSGSPIAGVSSSNHTGSGVGHVYVYDSIIRGFSHPLQADSDSAAHPATLTADFNDYDGTVLTVGFGSFELNDHVSNADPLFVDRAAGDYHLQASSPVIDLDAEPLVTLWDESPTDLDGSIRIINGKRDLGAFERPLTPAAATGDATDVTQTSATLPATANGGGGKATVKLVYGSTASYGSEMQFDPLAPSLVDQPYSIGLVGLSPGATYHYALVVTNAAGTTASADRTFTTGSPPPPPVCCAPPPVAKAALSALRISPSRFKAASKGATFARTKTGAKVTYRLSAAGKVKFTVLRAKRSKGRTRWVKVGKTISRTGKAGANTLRFSGRVRGKKLKPARYRLQSLDPSGATKRASFTIVRR
jgi:hypothetical protein